LALIFAKRALVSPPLASEGTSVPIT
jgi:hypothetical protein